MKILFLGHSLVAYFDWQGRFPRQQVLNLGVAGETTSGLLVRIDSIAADHPDADAVLVMTGTNDVLMGDWTFLEAYRKLTGKLSATYPKARIMLHSVLPVTPDWLDPAVIMEVNRKVHTIALGAGAEFLDLTGYFAGSGGEPHQELLLEDGVHLSSEGYRVWSEALEEKMGL